jgi:hypothetical protein
MVGEKKTDHDEGFNSFPGPLHLPAHHLRVEWFRECTNKLSVSEVRFTIKQAHKLGPRAVLFIISFELMCSSRKKYTVD